MKQFYICFCFSIFFISTIFSQNTFTNNSIPINAEESSIGCIDLFAGGAFGYVNGFAGGLSINFEYSNILFTLGYTMDNEQGGLEYVEEGIVPLNYYKHYRIDNFPVMVGVNPTRDLLNNDTFFEIEENLVTLNANFLKSHPDFEVLSVDEMFATLEEFVGHEIKRD